MSSTASLLVDTYTLGNSFGYERTTTHNHNNLDPSTLAQWTEGVNY